MQQSAAQQYFDAEDEAVWLPDSPAAHLEIDASYEIGHLEMMVENGLRTLGDACAAMRRAESDLQQFLSDYTAQVGHLLAELDGLHRQIAEYDRKLDAVPTRRSDTARREEAMLEVLREELPKLPRQLDRSIWEQEMQGIYHQLVTLYRPQNLQRERYSERVTRLLQQAYAQSNLWGMRVLEHSLVEHAEAKRDTPPRKLARLRERFDTIIATIQRMQDYTQSLQASPAMQLKQQAEGDAYWMDVLIHRAKMQIDVAQRVLTRKKIEYRIACS